jgi:hypothetical protein
LQSDPVARGRRGAGARSAGVARFRRGNDRRYHARTAAAHQQLQQQQLVGLRVDVGSVQQRVGVVGAAKGTCTSAATYASFWVGIDGDGSNTVEQTGSEVDCAGGRPQYFAWYEMFPAFPVNYTNTVKAGDSLHASVTASGTTFTLKISDTTQGWTHTQHKTLSSAHKHSAEVIAEAPSSGGGVLPLTNFGTVKFTSALANGTSIGTHSPDRITMVSGSTVKAKPSKLTSGQNFSVVWHHS